MTVGMAVPMIDAWERVTGTIAYVQDIALPGMAHAKVLRSPVPHARVVAVETAAAKASSGVLAVLTGADLAGDGRIDPIYGPQIKDQPILAIDRVRHVGDAIAAVAAESEEAAADALAAIEVEYDELPAVFDPLAALADGAPLLHDLATEREGTSLYFDIRPQPETNCCNLFRLRSGDVATGFAAADVVVEETFRTPAVQHVAMEPHVSIAAWNGDRLTVWTGTQTPFNTRAALAEIFRLPPENVRVATRTLGGSYGAKVFPRLEPIAAVLARAAGRPVRVAATRAEEFVLLNRHATVITVKLGVNRDGTLVAKQVTAYWDTGAYADCGPNVAQKGGFGTVGPYRIPHVAVDSSCVYTNTPPAGAFRGYAVTQAAWASECAIDLAAEAIGMDPLQFRLHNVLRDGDRFATGETMHDVHFAECLEDAAAVIGWGTPLPTVTDGMTAIGRGLCLVMKGMTTPSRSEARIEVDSDGVVTLFNSTVEMGQGAQTVLAQLAAAELGLAPDEVRVLSPDTDTTPFDNRTTSSRSTYMMGNAVTIAARDLSERILAAAAAQLEASPSDLRLDQGRVSVVGVPGQGVSVGDVVRGAGGERLIGEGSFANVGGLDPDTGQGIASSHWHQGAGAVEVGVDRETGKVEVRRCHASVYAGRVANAQTAALQNEGNMVFGLGSALYEEIAFDEGSVGNANLSDYLIPSFADLPHNISHNLSKCPDSNMHGIGETALPAIPAAIGNAVAAAVGHRIRNLPITPERVLVTLDAAADANADARGEGETAVNQMNRSRA